jgi:uncharacterized protein YehS (DUF1456 family)
MTNNSVLQKIQFALRLTPAHIVRIYKAVGFPMDDKKAIGYFIDVTRHEDYLACPNQAVAAFLEGLIIERRGVNEKNPGPPQITELALDNNDVFKKLRIALDLHTEDLEAILERSNTDIDIEKVDFSSIFRKKGHKHYKGCPDALLEAFLLGVRFAKA